MATVTLTAQTAPQSCPAGTVGGSYRFTLGSLSATVPYGAALVQASFPSVPSGTYQAGADLLDAAGAVLASAPPVSVTVPTSVTLQGPIGVTASVTFA